jgi:hypothetical protein
MNSNMQDAALSGKPYSNEELVYSCCTGKGVKAAAVYFRITKWARAKSKHSPSTRSFSHSVVSPTPSI